MLLLQADEGDYIQHFDFQSGPDATVPRRCHRYNALLEERRGLSVQSIVVLLAAKAYLTAFDGRYERSLPGESGLSLRFQYEVIRVWQLPVEKVLSEGPAVLPLAPISNVRKESLKAVIERMEERFAELPDRPQVAEPWTATKLLMGMRYDKVFTDLLLRGVRAMKESVTYEAIVEEGRLQEARKILLRTGTRLFGAPPSPEELQQLQDVTDIDWLEGLSDRVLDVHSWSELLAPVRPRRRKKS